MEVQERKVAKKSSKSKSTKHHPSSASDPLETKTNSKPHPNPISPNPNEDPPPATASRKNPNPNPNPKSSKPPKPSPSSPILPKSPTKSSKPPKSDAVMLDDPSSDPASPSRKSDRKRKARDFSDEEPSGKTSQAVQRRLADDNAVALLRAAIDFRSGTGSMPLPSNMGVFYEFVKASIPTPLSKEQVYNKLRHLRRKFQKSGPPGTGPNDGLVHDLSTKLWGAVDKKDHNEEKKAKEGTPMAVIKTGDAATVAIQEEEQQLGDGEERGVHGLDSLPYVSSVAAEHWKENGLWGVSWEAGLKRMDPPKARALEDKWRRQLGDEMKHQMDWFKTSRELLALLNDAYKGMST